MVGTNASDASALGQLAERTSAHAKSESEPATLPLEASEGKVGPIKATVATVSTPGEPEQSNELVDDGIRNPFSKGGELTEPTKAASPAISGESGARGTTRAKPKGKRTHKPTANVWSSSAMAAVSVMIAVAGICSAGVWPGAILEPTVGWDLGQFCQVGGIQVNSTLSQAFCGSYTDVCGPSDAGSSLLEATSYKYEFRVGVSSITATRTVNSMDLEGYTKAHVATVWKDSHRYILPQSDGNLDGSTFDEFRDANMPLTADQQKEYIALVHTETLTTPPSGKL